MKEKEKVYTEFETRLSKSREGINQLMSKVKEQSNESGQEAPALGTLHARQQEAEKRLEKLSQSDGDDWHRHKEDLHGYLEDIDARLREAFAYFH